MNEPMLPKQSGMSAIQSSSLSNDVNMDSISASENSKSNWSMEKSSKSSMAGGDRRGADSIRV